MLRDLIKNYILGIPSGIVFLSIYLAITIIFYGGINQHPNIKLVLSFGTPIGLIVIPAIVFLLRKLSWITERNYPITGVGLMLLFVAAISGYLYTMSAAYRDNLVMIFGDTHWAFPLSFTINCLVCTGPGFAYLFVLFSLDQHYERIVNSLFPPKKIKT